MSVERFRNRFLKHSNRSHRSYPLNEKICFQSKLACSYILQVDVRKDAEMMVELPKFLARMHRSKCWNIIQCRQVARRWNHTMTSTSSLPPSHPNPFPFPLHRNPTPYQIFRLPFTATASDIKAWCKLSFLTHAPRGYRDLKKRPGVDFFFG